MPKTPRPDNARHWKGGRDARLFVRLNADTKAMLRKMARDQFQSMADWLEQAVQDAWDLHVAAFPPRKDSDD